MAILKFKDSHALINYLCQESVLGELVISYSQDAPYASYNFDYSELEEHLDDVLSPLIDGISGVTSYELSFTDAEDWNITASDNDEYGSINLTEEINDMVREKVQSRLGIEDSYLLFDIEGSEDLRTLKPSDAALFKVKKFELFDWNGQEKELEVDEILRKELLEGITIILRKMNLALETTSYFHLDNNAGSDHINFDAEGSPFLSEGVDLGNGEEFVFDTEKLNAS